MLLIQGNGCVFNYSIFNKELEQLDIRNISWKGRLFLSENAHLTLNGHIQIENMFEESKQKLQSPFIFKNIKNFKSKFLIVNILSDHTMGIIWKQTNNNPHLYSTKLYTNLKP